jgi:putative FmdB family regulatory protein
MPTYDYRCPNGHDFERFFRKISEAEAELACPVCGAVAHRRVSGGAGLLFKGSGFYLTDYGKNAHRKGDAPAAESKGESASKGDGAKKEGDAAAKSEPASATPKAESPTSSETKSTGKTKGGDPK